MHPLLVSRLLLAAAPLCGGPIDLDTALGLALTRSDEVAIRRGELAAAEADRAIARALRWIPSASATGAIGPSPAARGDPALRGTPGWPLSAPRAQDTTSNLIDKLEHAEVFARLELQFVQPLYTWGRLDAASDAAEAGVRARTALVQDTAAQIQLRIQQLWWGISLARRFLAIADDVTRAIEDAAKRIQQAIAEGDADIGPSDRFKVEVFRGTVLGRAAEAQKGLEQAQIGLAATLGVSPDALQLKELPLEAAEAPLPSPAQAREAAERQRPDLRALDEAIAARTAEVQAERGAMLPQVFIAGQFAWAWAPNRDDPANPWVSDPLHTHSDYPTGGVILGLRQDLSFPTLSARVRKAEAERATLQRQRAGLGRLVEVQVDNALSELKAAQTRFVAARGSFNAARALYRAAGLDFAAGLVETGPLIDAYKQYVENQVSVAQATFDLNVARAKLVQVTGEAPRKAITCE